MKLENQVVSLELAQKLKELGVKQESLFYWVAGDKEREKCPECKKAGGIIPECYYCGGTGKGAYKQNYYLYSAKECFNDGRYKDYSSFTIAELGEMLHEYITSIEPSNKGWQIIRRRVEFCTLSENNEDDCMEAYTEADARAKMLIYLLENKLITLN